MSLYRTGGWRASQCTRGSGVAHKRDVHVSDRPTPRGTDSCSGDRDLRTEAVVEGGVLGDRSGRSAPGGRLRSTDTERDENGHVATRPGVFTHDRLPAKTHDVSRSPLTTPGGRTEALGVDGIRWALRWPLRSSVYPAQPAVVGRPSPGTPIAIGTDQSVPIRIGAVSFSSDNHTLARSNSS